MTSITAGQFRTLQPSFQRSTRCLLCTVRNSLITHQYPREESFWQFGVPLPNKEEASGTDPPAETSLDASAVKQRLFFFQIQGNRSRWSSTSQWLPLQALWKCLQSAYEPNASSVSDVLWLTILQQNVFESLCRKVERLRLGACGCPLCCP